MPVKVGNVVEGTVTGITNFGAFVQLPEGETGLVHISEVSHEYVSDIKKHLKNKQKVTVKVLSIEGGKISLSIRQAKPKRNKNQPSQIDWSKKTERLQRNMTFEDKMMQFLKDSTERQDQLKSRESKKGNYKSR